MIADLSEIEPESRSSRPQAVATVAAIRRRLVANEPRCDLPSRDLPADLPDGLEGHEGPLLLGSSGRADVPALQVRPDEAHDLFDSPCARANPLGLPPEQVAPDTGASPGNFPQAFSHVGPFSTGVNLARIERGELP